MRQRSRRALLGPGFRRVLWPTDFSPLANAALPQALRFAGDGGAELAVLHVLSPATLYALPEMPAQLWEALERGNRAAAKAKLHRIIEQVKRKVPKVRVHAVLVEGVPFEQIVRGAKRLQCDLIVIATHGRTGLQHALVGSVAENVVRRAPCPVLTVRPPGAPPPR